MNERNNSQIEIITVRLNPCGDTGGFQEILKELAAASAQEQDIDSITIYKSENIENDWAIHLKHSIAVKGDKSPFAMNVSEELHSFGLVHHKLWRHIELSKPLKNI